MGLGDVIALLLLFVRYSTNSVRLSFLNRVIANVTTSGGARLRIWSFAAYFHPDSCLGMGDSTVTIAMRHSCFACMVGLQTCLSDKNHAILNWKHPLTGKFVLVAIRHQFRIPYQAQT